MQKQAKEREERQSEEPAIQEISNESREQTKNPQLKK